MKFGMAHVIFKSFSFFFPIMFTSLASIKIQGVRRFLQLLTLAIYNKGLYSIQTSSSFLAVSNRLKHVN